MPVVLKNRSSSQEGVRTPCTLPLDPPLRLLPGSLAERVGETVGRKEERGILACQQGPLLKKLPGGGELKGGGSSRRARSLAAGFGGESWGGRGSKRPWTQARSFSLDAG